MRRPHLCFLTCLVALLATFTPPLAARADDGAQAKDECEYTVRVHHASGTAVLERRGTKLEDVSSSEVTRIVSSKPVCFVVDETATALYAVSLDEVGAVDVGNMAALSKFIGSDKARDTLLEMGRGALGEPLKPTARVGFGLAGGQASEAERERVRSAMDAAKKDLDAIDASLRTLEDTRQRTFFALNHMALAPTKAKDIATQLKTALAARFQCLEGTKGEKCPLVQTDLVALSQRFEDLAQKSDTLRQKVLEVELGELDATVQDLLRRSDARRADLPALLSRSQEAGALAVAAWTSEPEKTLTSKAVSWETAKLYALRITPRRADDPIGAVRKPVTYSFKIVPERGPRFGVGAALLYVYNAVYPKYGASTVNGTKQIVESGSSDQRLSWGITLGLTYEPLDFRDSDNAAKGLAVWLPEIFFGPMDLSFGAGVAVSWKVLKLGTGAIWARHPLLDHQKLGDPLGADQTPKTKDGYEAIPKWYVSLSVFY
ncbi:MAG: hypothetical protein QM765_37555 [Myxococcales bacterium]